MNNLEKQTKTHCEQLTKFLCQHNFIARSWLGFRVYLNGYGKDIQAYFEIDATDNEFLSDQPLSGTNLKVWSTCKQHPNWLLNRCKQVKCQIMHDLKNAGIFNGEVCENWREIVL